MNLQSWTNFFGTLVSISVQCTFFELQMPPTSPLINVGHKLVHFQPCILFSLHFLQATLSWGVGRGLQKNPEYVIKGEFKDKMLYYSTVPMYLSMIVDVNDKIHLK